ncbi:ABC transporter permease [Catellatospora sichuanensis]|uniref:ABC transporter permease n=1 Tax=Catellatospora sichuanensis TaxID=1969805 RepID=UPI001182439D|nr:ABC transporter permease [Catellatospora sichuanensis]
MIRLSGRLRSALIIGGQGIRARKTRTLLSIVSLFLGVLAVVVVQAGAEAANQAALADIELQVGKDGTRMMYVSPEKAGAMAAALETLKGRSDAVGVIGTSVTIGEPGVNPVNPGGAPFDQQAGGPDYYYGGGPGAEMICDERGCRPVDKAQQGEQTPNGQAIELRLSALTGDVLPFRPYRMKSGQWLDFTKVPSLSPGIVVNLEAAKGFARYQVPAEMRIYGASTNATPRIIGVVDDGVPMPTAYTRVDELLNWVPASSLSMMGGVETLLAPDAYAVEQTLRARLVGLGVPAEQLRVEPVNARKAIEEQLRLVRLVFLGIAGLVLLIGVAGILNVGLATVGERVEEFALRRAVGTPRTLLAGIVLAETLLTGLFTAAAAIGVASLALKVVGSILSGRTPIPLDMEFPWQAGVAGIVAGLVAGLLGGLIPAIRAARIPIATVMRA